MTTSLSSSAWLSAVHRYGSTPIDNGRGGTFQPIGAKDLRFLNELAALDTSYADIGALLEAGKDVRVFSDPHFSHANIIRFCVRPFDDVESMDAALWKAYPRGVRRSGPGLVLRRLVAEKSVARGKANDQPLGRQSVGGYWKPRHARKPPKAMGRRRGSQYIGIFRVEDMASRPSS